MSYSHEEKQLLSRIFGAALVLVLLVLVLAFGLRLARNAKPAQPSTPAAAGVASPLPSLPARLLHPAAVHSSPIPPAPKRAPVHHSPPPAPPLPATLKKTAAAPVAPPASGQYRFYVELPRGGKALPPANAPKAQETHYSWRIQIGAFREAKPAEVVRKKVAAWPVTVVHNGRFYLIQIGPYGARERAEQVEKALQAKGFKTLLRRSN